MKKQKKKVLSISTGIAIVLFAMVFFAHSANAATYYVDADNGNNSYDGLSQTYSSSNHGPWKTGPQVTPSPGDTILYKSGTTNEYAPFVVNWKGSAGNVINFNSYGTGHQPVISAVYDKTPVTGWSGPTGGIYNKNIGAMSLGQGALIEGQYGLVEASDATLKNGYWYYNSSTHILYYKPTDGVNNHTVRLANDPAYTMYQGQDNIDSYTTYNNFQFIGGYLSISVGAYDYSHLTFQNCTFTGLSAYYGAIQISAAAGHVASYITFDHCTWDHCGPSPMYFVYGNSDSSYFDHCTIQNSKFNQCGYSYGPDKYNWSSMGESEAIPVQNGSNFLVQNNEISGYYNYGAMDFWESSAFGSTNNIIRYNYIHDVVGAGIVYGGETATGTSYGQIYGNIIDRVTGASSIYAGAIFTNKANSSTNKLKIYNNTIQNCDYGLYLLTQADYVDLKNNSVVGCSTPVYIDSTSSHNTIDYNDYYPTTGSPFIYHGSAQSWATWHGAGRDTNSLQVDPKFANISGNFSKDTDFQLASGSPAIGKGTNVSLTTDYAGNTFSNPPSIGAYEYTSGNTPPPTYSSADLNQDGSVNATDFNIIKTDFFKLITNLLNPRSDIDADGQVTAKDVGIMMSAWGTDPNPPPTSSGTDYIAGCQIFSAGTGVHTDVSKLSPLPASASLIAPIASKSIGGLNSPYALHAIPYDQSTVKVSPQVSWNSFSDPWPLDSWTESAMAAFGTIDSDYAMEIVQQAGGGQPCRLWEGFNFHYSNGSWNAYSGCKLNGDGPQPTGINQPTCNSLDNSRSGMNLSADIIPSQVIAAANNGTTINHALHWEFPAANQCDSGGTTVSPCMPYNATLRLHASYPLPSNPQAAAVIQALKTYGLIPADNGCCFGAYNFAPISELNEPDMDRDAINAALTPIHWSDFDVVTNDQ